MNTNIDLMEDVKLEEILEGLSKKDKIISSKFFYDERGSKLFDQICELDEYYPTRTELKIMEDNIDQIVNCIKENSIFFEFGSGSSLKTKLLLKHLNQIQAYVPIDISEAYLLDTADKLRKMFPNITIHPIVADYTGTIDFPDEFKNSETRTAYFPGSTIGNFTPTEAREFLRMTAEKAGKNGSLLIGIDLIKDPQVLHNAYNDAKGITAEFNLNLLHRFVNEYNADIKLNNFKHVAFYNSNESRIEMHIESLADQKIEIADQSFSLEKEERILTEYSYKYSIESFEKLVDGIFSIKNIWTDENNYFGLFYLDVIS